MLPGSTEPTRSLGFSLAPLINALQDYIDTFDAMTSAQRVEKWCTKVGAEQLLLPVKCLQDYCNPDVPFYPTPSFDAPTFPRCLEIYNSNTRKVISVWGDVDNGGILGRDFGIVRGPVTRYGATVLGCGDGGAELSRIERLGWELCDSVALRACEGRTALDLAAFKQKLQEPLNQQPVPEQESWHCSIS